MTRRGTPRKGGNGRLLKGAPNPQQIMRTGIASQEGAGDVSHPSQNHYAFAEVEQRAFKKLEHLERRIDSELLNLGKRHRTDHGPSREPNKGRPPTGEKDMSPPSPKTPRDTDLTERQ